MFEHAAVAPPLIAPSRHPQRPPFGQPVAISCSASQCTDPSGARARLQQMLNHQRERSSCLGPPERTLAGPDRRRDQGELSHEVGASARSSRQLPLASGKSADASTIPTRPSAAAPGRSSTQGSGKSAGGRCEEPGLGEFFDCEKASGSTILALIGARPRRSERPATGLFVPRPVWLTGAARRDKIAPHRSDTGEMPGSMSGDGTRSTRRARSSAVARRVSSTRRNQQSASSATRSPALSKRAISAEIDRTPIRVSRSWARRGTRPNGARSRTRPKRHGRKLTPSTWCWRSARSPSSACNAPSSKAG